MGFEILEQSSPLCEEIVAHADDLMQDGKVLIVLSAGGDGPNKGILEGLFTFLHVLPYCDGEDEETRKLGVKFIVDTEDWMYGCIITTKPRAELFNFQMAGINNGLDGGISYFIHPRPEVYLREARAFKKQHDRAKRARVD